MKRRRPLMAETALAAAVVAHFRSVPGARVYQEVAPDRGRRADLVVSVGPVLHVIECKLVFGFAVLRQAEAWTREAHRVSIATAYARDSYAGSLSQRVCKMLGLGWLEVTCDNWDGTRDEWKVRELVPAPLRRRVETSLRDALMPEHETFAPAGSNKARYWSPWRATCKALREFVAEHPGCTLKAAVAGIVHHYARDSTARSSLAHWIAAKKVEGVAWRTVDGKRGLYAEAVADA